MDSSSHEGCVGVGWGGGDGHVEFLGHHLGQWGCVVVVRSRWSVVVIDIGHGACHGLRQGHTAARTPHGTIGTTSF